MGLIVTQKKPKTITKEKYVDGKILELDIMTHVNNIGTIILTYEENEDAKMEDHILKNCRKR